MPVKVTCMHRVTYKGKVVRYGLADDYGKLVEMTPKEIKEAIRSGKITVSNMKITSDGRLISSHSRRWYLREG